MFDGIIQQKTSVFILQNDWPDKKTGTAETVPVFVECLKLLGFVLD